MAATLSKYPTPCCHFLLGAFPWRLSGKRAGPFGRLIAFQHVHDVKAPCIAFISAVGALKIVSPSMVNRGHFLFNSLNALILLRDYLKATKLRDCLKIQHPYTIGYSIAAPQAFFKFN